MLLALPFVVQVIVFLMYGRILMLAQDLDDKTIHARELVGRTNWLSAMVVLSAFDRGGFLATGDPRYEVAAGNSLSSANSEAKVFRSSMAQKPSIPSASQFLAGIDNVLQSVSPNRSSASEHTISGERARSINDGKAQTQLIAEKEELPSRDSVVKFFNRSEIKALTEKFWLDRSRMLADERAQLSINPDSLPKARKAMQNLLSAGIVVDIAAAVILMLVFTRSIARRLEVVSDNALRLARKQPLNQEVGGDDEISSVDQMFHTMAAALEDSARRERAIVQNAVDVICSIGSDGRIRDINPACLKAWGYCEDELIGMRFAELLSEDTKSHSLDAIEKSKDSGNILTLENQVIGKDQSIIEVAWSMAWSSEAKALFCVAHDITERKRIEQLKRDFLAMVSHDLRSPLTSVQAHFDMLSSGMYGEPSEKLSKSSARAERNIIRVVDLINDMLDVEKLDSNTLDLELTEVSLGEVLLDAKNALQALADEHKITLDVRTCDYELNADWQRLGQVFVNLISNAMKFSPDGSTIEVYATDSDGYAEISVQDHGRGIPPEHLETIFERFKQVRAADGRRGRGSGLGLAICKALVEQHEGTIGVESKLTEGSRFWVRLPLLEREAGHKIDLRETLQPAKQTHQP